MEKINTPYTTVCVMPGTILGPARVPEFTAYFLEKEGVRVRYLEEIVTGPDIDANGKPVAGTGGRNDLLFAVHDADVPRFAVRRFMYGVRWLEDALNTHASIYPKRVHRLIQSQ